MDLFEREHPEILAGIEGGVWKRVTFSVQMLYYLWNGTRSYYWGPVYEVLYGAKIDDLVWPWRAIMHSVSKHVCLSEPITKILMKTGLY